jgi:hypothetical protein
MEFLYLLAISYGTPQSFCLYISFFPFFLGGCGGGGGVMGLKDKTKYKNSKPSRSESTKIVPDIILKNK